MKYIYHHQGLGDHIICNGLVRYYKEKEDVINLFCKTQYYENIKYMYRDDENIVIIPLLNDNEVVNYITSKKIQNQTIFVGFSDLHKYRTPTFDESFYISKNLNFELRFSNFLFKRDFELEKEIVKKLNPNNEKYIFTHNVDKNKIRTDLKIIENPSEYSIFNLLSLLEDAEEVHLMESSIKCLVNSYYMEKPNFFYHRYVRKYPEYYNTKGLNKFQIID